MNGDRNRRRRGPHRGAAGHERAAGCGERIINGKEVNDMNNTIDLLDQTEIDARFDELVLDIEDLESLEAPGFWEGLSASSPATAPSPSASL
jgi:hypothetical protein